MLSNCLLWTLLFSLSMVIDAFTDIASPIYQRNIYNRAVKLIEEAKSSPSCIRVAAHNLIESCQSLEISPAQSGHKRGTTAPLLDRVKSTYAARLALCELAEAQVGIPLGCRSFVPSPQPIKNGKQRSLGYDNVNDADLAGCLQELATSQQHWVSYSNAKQNAIVMCQAVRHEIEKDEMLEVHRSMASVLTDLDSALAASAQQTNQELAEQKAFADTIKKFQSQLLQELEHGKSETGTFLEHLHQQLGSASQAFMGAVHRAGEAVHDQVEHLNLIILQSAREAGKSRDQIQEVVETAVRGTTELANSQLQHWQASHDLATDLHRSLEHVSSQHIHGMVRMIEKLSHQLETSSSLIALIHQRQSTLDDSLGNLHDSVSRLQAKALALEQAQEEHADVQLNSFQAFKSEMNAAIRSIGNVTAALADFQAQVNDTSQSFRSMLSLWSAAFPVRGICFALLILLNLASVFGLVFLTILGWVNPTTAVRTFGIACCLETCLWITTYVAFSNGPGWLVGKAIQAVLQSDVTSETAVSGLSPPPVHRLYALGIVICTVPLALYTWAKLRLKAKLHADSYT